MPSKGISFRGDPKMKGVVQIFKGSKTHDFADTADGEPMNTTVTATGARLGDYAMAQLNVTGGVPANALLAAHVTAADTVTVTILNETGGQLNLGSGTLSVLVIGERDI